MFKRLLSLLVTVTMLVSLIPAGVFAEGDAVVTETVEQVVVQPEPEKEEPKQEEKEPETPVEEPKEPEAAPTEEPKETEAPVEEPVEEEPVEEEPAQEELLEDELLDDAEDPMAALTERQKAFAEAANTVHMVDPQYITFEHFDKIENAYAAYQAIVTAGEEVEPVQDYKGFVDTAKTALIAFYNNTFTAIGADENNLWEKQADIKAFNVMKVKMEASTYVKAEATLADTSIIDTAMTAYATAEASIGDVDYATLQAALDAVAADQTVTIKKNLSYTATVEVTKSATIDLNTHTVAFALSDAVQTGLDIKNSAVVTIKNGTLSGAVAQGTKDNLAEAKDPQGKIAMIVATEGANVTLEGVTAELTAPESAQDKVGKVIRVNGATVNATKGTNIHSDKRAVLVEEDGTFTAKESTIDADGQLTIKALGAEGHIANIDLNTSTVTGQYCIQPASHSKLVMRGVNVTGTGGAVYGNGLESNAVIEITGGKLTTTGAEATSLDDAAVYMPSTKSLTMKNTTIDASCVGIEIKAGETTLNNVTINAGKAVKTSPNYNNSDGISGYGDAVVVIANKNYGKETSVKLTVTGGSYTSTLGNAIAYGYHSETTAANRTLTIAVSGATLEAKAEGKQAIYHLGTVPGTVTVSNITTMPKVDENNITRVQGQMIMPIDGEKSVIYATMREALSANRTLKLGADYKNDSDEAYIITNTELDANGFAIETASVRVKGKLTSSDNDVLTTKATVLNNGQLVINNKLLIANVATENKPVFGMNDGAQITAVKNANGGIDYEAIKGDIFIQCGFDGTNAFKLPENSTLTITAPAKVWAPNGVTVDMNGITGELSMPVVKIGDVDYASLRDAMAAVKEGETIEVLQDITAVGGYTASTPNGANFTIDTKGHTVTFTGYSTGNVWKSSAGLSITRGNVTLTGGGKLVGDGSSNCVVFVGMDTANQAEKPGNLTIDNVDISFSGSTSAQQAAVYVGYNGTVTLKKTNISAHNTGGQASGVRLEGDSAEAMANVKAEPANRYDVKIDGDYAVLAVKNANYTLDGVDITAKRMGITGNGNAGNDNNVGKVTNSRIVVSNESNPTLGVYLPSIGTLNISGSTIKANAGVEVRSGSATIEACTIEADGANAASIANSTASSGGDGIVVAGYNVYQGTAIDVTIKDTTVTSKNQNAIYVERVAGDTKTITVKVEGSELNAATGKLPIKAVSLTADEIKAITVADITTTPVLTAGNYTLADGQVLINIDYENIPDGTITRATLSEAINARDDHYARLTLPMSYINREDNIVATSDMSLFVSGEGTVLDVNSLKIYHQVSMREGTSLRANELEAIRNPDSDEDGLLNLRNIGQLLDNTTVVVKSNVDKDGMGSGMLSIGGKYVISSQTGGYVGLFKPGRGAEMRVSARNVGTTEAPQYVADYQVIAGEVTIANNGQATFDIGDDYLTISDDAIVTLGDGVGMTAISEHITGTITTPDIAVLKALLAAFDKAPAEVTYEDYKTVKAILAARDEVRTNGRQALAQTEFEKVKAYEDTYLIRYVLTAPKILTLKADTNLVEIGGAGVVFTVEYDTLLPDDVEQCAKDNFDITYGFNEGEKFAANTETMTVTTDGAEKNNVGTLTARLVQKTTEQNKPTAVATAEMLFRAIPNSASVKLTEVVLGSYNEVVNLKYSSQDVTIPVMYAFDNEMSYDLRGYKVTGVTWADGTDKTPIKDVYGIVFDPADPDHVTLEAIVENGALKIAKNKTYTGNLVFTVTDANDQPVQVPATALLSVKVTDVAPKVTVKLGTLDVFLNRISMPSTGYDYAYSPVVITLGGANVDDVEGITIEDTDDIDYECTYDAESEQYLLWLESKGENPIGKGTLKPVMTVEFTDDSHFAPLTLANTKGVGTVSLKVTETSPAIKLDKSSLTVSGTKDATVDVSVIATNKKAPFDLSTISGVEALEVTKTASTAHPYVSAALAGDEGTVTLTVTEGFSQLKNTKVTLRFAFDDTDKTKDLVVTLNVKTTAIKLGKSSADMNILSADKVARIPVTVTPQTDAAVLEKITVTVSKTETKEYEPVNGEIDVEGMLFSIEDGNTLVVDGENATLVKGSLKYNLFFAGAAKTIAFTVKVSEKFQTVKLGKSSVSVNATLNDYAIVPIVYSDGNLDDSQLTVQCSNAIVWQYDQYAGELLVGYVDADSAQNSEKLTITIADANLAPKKDVLTLTVKKVVKPVVMKVSIKGSLDTLTDNSMVAATVSFSGTTGGYNMKTFAKDQNLDVNNFTLTDPTNALEIKDSEYDAKGNLVLYIGWAAGENLKGPGKYNVGISMYDSDSDLDIKLAKPVAVSATIGKFKVTAQTATLFQALRLESTDLVLDAGYATISDVSIKGTNNFYVVEKGIAGWTIRYADDFAGFGNKWKANDSVTLNVKVEGGANKLYTVKLPIVNIEKQAEDAQ